MKIKFIIFIVSLLSVLASANCENQLFSFQVKETSESSITILDVLENITDECKITMVFEDGFVNSKLGKKLNYINVKDFSLTQLLELLLSDRNFFYTLDENQKILKISYLQTKSYFLDYVSFTKRSSSSSKTINSGGSSGGSTSNGITSNGISQNGIIANNNSSSGGSDSTTMNNTSDFQFWNEIKSEIDGILHRGEDTNKIPSQTLINQDAGIVTVTGTKKQLDRVERYIESMMKRLHKEILVEVKLIEVRYDDSKSEGINWSKFELGLHGSSDATSSYTAGMRTDEFKKPNYMIGYNFSMDGLIKFLSTQGKVHIVSNPKIMTLNNQPAIINVGTQVNYRYDNGSATTISNGSTTTTPSYSSGSTFVGVTLDITPQVTSDDYIMLKINPSISEISENHIDPVTGIPFLAPDIKVKQLSSIVKVKDGNKVLIGGLINKNETIEDNSVPGLSSIPLLGAAFRSHDTVQTNSELIIVLIPHIIDINQKPSLDEFDTSLSGEKR